MQESATYSVVLSGKIKSGFESQSVIEAFAQLFKMPPEKAEKLLGTRFVIKKEVDLKVAKQYKDKLSAIGVDVALKRHGGIDALSLEPVEHEEEAPAEAVADANAAPPKPSSPDGMICPKCHLEQPKADECSACGVFVQKVLAAQASAPAPATAPAAAAPASAVESETSIDDDYPPEWKFIALPAVVAVLGAFVWYFIAMSLEREFGLIAWALGGAVGYAALLRGARGHAAGVACGILVLLSILGGKYMTQSALQSEYALMVQTSDEVDGIDLQELYQVEVGEAREYAKLDGSETSLRLFLVDHGYSEADDADGVTPAEIDDFVSFFQSRLESIVADRLSYDEWRQIALSNSIEEYSTLDLMVESLGLIDILFLFFGIGSAYQLANRGKG